MDMVAPGKIRRVLPRRRWIDNTREDMNKCEMTGQMKRLKTDNTGNDGKEWSTIIIMRIRSLKVRKMPVS